MNFQMEQYTMDDCIFCKAVKNPHDSEMCVLGHSKNWIIVEDGFPVTKGHTLLIPKRHCENVFQLNEEERNELHEVIGTAKTLARARHGKIDGWNIGANCGEAAGQTIMHCHIHLIPRRNGDCENPRGGVRGCVPSRMSY